MSLFERIATGLQFPEGPAFDGQGRLWCVEIEGGCLSLIDGARSVVRIETGGKPNGIAYDKQGFFWVCDQTQGLLTVDIQTFEVSTVLKEAGGKPLARPNDVIASDDGSAIFTCPGDSREDPSGEVWVVRNDVVQPVHTAMQFPNGLTFYNDEQSLIIAETYRQRLWRGEWDAVNHKWRDPAPWVDVGGPVGPDGVAVSSEGYVLAAIFGGQRIAVVDPTGSLMGHVKTPAAKPSNLCFSPDGQNLFVTEVEEGVILKTNWLELQEGLKP